MQPKPYMTKTEFIAYATQILFNQDYLEPVFDQIAEAAGEIARFGDCGPGVLYRLRREASDFNRIAGTFERLTGRPAPRFPALPHPR